MNGCQRTCLYVLCVGTFKMRPLKVFMKQTQQTKCRLRCSWLSHRELLWHWAATTVYCLSDQIVTQSVLRVLKRRLRGGPMNSVWRRFDILKYFEWIKLKMSSRWGVTGAGLLSSSSYSHPEVRGHGVSRKHTVAVMRESTHTRRVGKSLVCFLWDSISNLFLGQIVCCYFWSLY